MNYIVLDVETTNGFDDPLVYDCGWSVITDDEKTLSTRSYVNADIFLDEPELMKQAYFAEKIPQYFQDIADKKRTLAHWKTIRQALHFDCRFWEVQAIVAHNARFDYRACQVTQRLLTSSKWRWFFPWDVVIYDSLKMSKQTFAKNEAYKQFCKENNYTLASGYPRLTAEILYKFISGDNNFEESHTGLEDTTIEKEIFWECLKMNPDIDCYCWEQTKEQEEE